MYYNQLIYRKMMAEHFWTLGKSGGFTLTFMIHC